MTSRAFFKKITVPATKKCSGSIIMLHGSGGTGLYSKEDFKYILGEDLTFPHLQIHYLTAPLMPYTLNGGFPQNVWFDRLSLEESSPEYLESIDKMATMLNRVIDEEVQEGFPLKRIIIGGFSMGGAMSLHLGLRFQPKVAGIFSLSSFLSTDSQVYKDISKRTEPFPPLFMAHGDEDDLVPFSWGKKTVDRLSQIGMNIVFHSFSGLNHETSKNELLTLKKWISTVLPDNSK